MKALQTNKSTGGPNNIQLKLLKLASNAIAPSLVRLYKHSIESKTMFNSWKKARLTPIFKKDDETGMENYRPISLQSVPSKILESKVNDTLLQHVFKDNDLVTDRQWAYRAGYSTELLLVHLTEELKYAVDKGMFVAVAFVDF